MKNDDSEKSLFLYHQLLGVGERIVKNESAFSVYHQDSKFNYDVHQLQSELLSTFIQPHSHWKMLLRVSSPHHKFRNNYDTFASDLMDQVSSEATQSDMRFLDDDVARYAE